MKANNLTLRDWLAGQAMPVLITDEDTAFMTIRDAATYIGVKEEDYNYRTHWPRIVAKLSYEYADAMIAARGGWREHIDQQSGDNAAAFDWQPVAEEIEGEIEEGSLSPHG